MNINGIIYYILLCLAFLLNILFVKFSHVAECSNSFFVFIAVQFSALWMCHNMLIHSPVGDYLDCFQSLTVTSSAAMNILVNVTC